MSQPIPSPDAKGSQSPAGAGRLSLLHVSDIHLWRIGLDGDFTLKRLLGLGNLMLKRSRLFPPAVAQALAERLAAEQADWLLFSGDLTTTSLRAEFEAGRTLFEPLRRRWGDRLIAIPGNHDRYTPRASRLRLFEELFAGAGWAYPCAVDLDPVWTLVLLDFCVPRRLSARGHLDEEGLRRIGALLEQIRSRGRRIAAMGHYPAAFPGGVEAKWDHALPQRQQLLELLQHHDVRLYVHGHKHRRWRLKAGVMELLNSGSGGLMGHERARHPGFLRIELGPEGVQSVHVTSLPPDKADNIIGLNDWTTEPLEILPC